MFNRRSTSEPSGTPDGAAPADPLAVPEDSMATARDTDAAVPPAPATPAPATPVEPEKPAAAPIDRRQKGLTDKGKVRTTRVSALWVGLVSAAILAIFLLVFIAQNLDKVTIRFLGFEGQLSLAIALLLAAVIGILVVAVPGTLRIGQLRRALRKNAKH